MATGNPVALMAPKKWGFLIQGARWRKTIRALGQAKKVVSGRPERPAVPNRVRSRKSREDRRAMSDNGRQRSEFFNAPPAPPVDRTNNYDQNLIPDGADQAGRVKQSSQNRAPRPKHRRAISDFEYPPAYAQPPMLEPIIAGEQLDTDVSMLPSNLKGRPPSRDYSRDANRQSYGAIGHGGDRRRYGSADDAKLYRTMAKTASERQFSGRGELQSYAENFSLSKSRRGPSVPVSPGGTSYQHGTPPMSPSGSLHSLLNNKAGSFRGLPTRGVYGSDQGSDMEPFLAQNFGNLGPRQGSFRSLTSNRRTHMRHHSAQLYMSKVKGDKQPKTCRDSFFAFLFTLQLALMVAIAIYFGPEAMASYENSDIPTQDSTVIVHYTHLLQLAIFCGLFACTLSGLALFFMAIFSKEVIKICLIASIALSFAWGTIGIGLRPTSFVPVTGIIVLALCVGYAFVVWSRIPFAAANLRTGLAGVKSRLGVAVIAYFFQAVALGWSILWVFAAVGVYDFVHGCSKSYSLCETKVHFTIIAGFMISYVWTLQVLTYVVQVIVAGAVENWWSQNDSECHADSCWPASLRENLLNALTHSFGSVCYGSLLVGPVQTVRQLLEPMRPKDQPSLLCFNQLLLPLQRLIFSWIDTAVVHCNQFSFTYLGIYHYPFMEAGKHATDLLEQRGWSNIANDDLLGNVVYMFGLVIGGCTGCFAVVVQQIDHYQIVSNSNQSSLAFLSGLLIGLVLSNVLMSAVIGAVNAVIICFAENPWDFQMNHPELCADMNLAWSTVWPGCLSGQKVTGSDRDILHATLRPWDLAV